MLLLSARASFVCFRNTIACMHHQGMTTLTMLLYYGIWTQFWCTIKFFQNFVLEQSVGIIASMLQWASYFLVWYDFVYPVLTKLLEWFKQSRFIKLKIIENSNTSAAEKTPLISSIYIQFFWLILLAIHVWSFAFEKITQYHDSLTFIEQVLNNAYDKL